MTGLLKGLRNFVVAAALLFGLALAAVWLLRVATTDASLHEAQARLGAPSPPLSGENGFVWLAFADHEVPAGDLPAALAEDVAAFTAWQQDQGKRWHAAAGGGTALLAEAGAGQGWRSPVASRHPRRPELKLDAACNYRELDCLQKVQADPGPVRGLLAAEAARADLADRALFADHLANPYPETLESPMPAFQLWRLSLTRTALQAVDGDPAGAMARACVQFASARRHGAQARHLVDKMVAVAFAEGSGGLLLALRTAHPALALPPECDPALAPVQNADFQICESLRSEYRMHANLVGQLEQAQRESWHPRDLLSRALLQDSGLHQLWLAEGFGESCSEAFHAEVQRGEAPPLMSSAVDRGQLRCYAAFVNCILVEVARPSFDTYQRRLLDHAAKQRVLVAALQVADGRVAPADAVALAASPGYAVRAEGESALAVTLRGAREGESEFILPLVPPSGDTAAAEPSQG